MPANIFTHCVINAYGYSCIYKNFMNHCWIFTSLIYSYFNISCLGYSCISIQWEEYLSRVEKKWVVTVGFSVQTFAFSCCSGLVRYVYNLRYLLFTAEYKVAEFVEAQIYEHEDGDFDSRWSHLYFSLTKYGPGLDSASNRNQYYEHLLGLKADFIGWFSRNCSRLVLWETLGPIHACTETELPLNIHGRVP
jgi:hypothetical protein